MIDVLFYGLTVGSILYMVSVGLSLTFGIMKIVNFSHALVYTIGPYILITYLSKVHGSYVVGSISGLLVVIPVSYLVERFLIRKLYGTAIDLAIIATYAVLLIGIDVIKFIWGATPIPLSDPLNLRIGFLFSSLPVYRILVVAFSVITHIFLLLFFNNTMIGKIVTAGLEDEDGVKSLGINIGTYYSIVFVMGSCLAALGGILYSPITAVHPYMGLSILLLSFAVVMVGGMGSIKGTFYSAILIGLIMSFVGRLWGPLAETIPFIIMAIVIMIRKKPVDV